MFFDVLNKVIIMAQVM